jgi:predicted metal-binding membrane protein
VREPRRAAGGPSSGWSVLETLAGRGGERRVVLAALGALTALAWVYLWRAPMPMPAANGGLRAPEYAALTFAMWFVMMVGMMTPAAAPVVMLFDRVERNQAHAAAALRTPLFLLGYLLVWDVFSLVATLLQIELIAAGWIDDMGVAARGIGTALLLAGAGIYQWLPLKRACLSRCHSPVEFLVQHRRPGRSGALYMGARHGMHCLGCCWALMLLLFVGGVMNLLWVVVIALIVLAEKLVPRGWLRHVIGVALCGAAVLMLVRLP